MPIINLEENTFEAGTFVRVHGVQGRLLLRLNRSIIELEDFPEWVFIRIDDGLVPFRVAEESVAQKDDHHLIIGLDEVTNQDKALNMVGLQCCLEGDWNEWFMSDTQIEPAIIGFSVTNILTGEVGIVTGFEDIPGNPLWEIEIRGKQVLVPDRDDYVIEKDEVSRQLTLRIPDDLLNLQD
jgi:ribosomal 30S subunit maturation factor RimM